MGEANNRGTYAQRKQLAITKQNEERRVQQEIMIRRPSPKRSNLFTMLIAATAAVTVDTTLCTNYQKRGK